MIRGPPKVVRFTVNLYENLVQMRLPVRIGTHPADPVSPDFGGKQRPKPVPPKSNCLMADVDPALMQKVFNITKRKRKTNVQHHSKANDLRAGLEIAGWAVFGHAGRL